MLHHGSAILRWGVSLLGASLRGGAASLGAILRWGVSSLGTALRGGGSQLGAALRGGAVWLGAALRGGAALLGAALGGGVASLGATLRGGAIPLASQDDGVLLLLGWGASVSCGSAKVLALHALWVEVAVVMGVSAGAVAGVARSAGWGSLSSLRGAVTSLAPRAES